MSNFSESTHMEEDEGIFLIGKQTGLSFIKSYMNMQTRNYDEVSFTM